LLTSAWEILQAAGIASNIVDAQATLEISASLWGTIMDGADMLIQGAGWLTASYEKFIIYIEILQGFNEMFHPVLASENDICFDAMKEVGPGGHDFAVGHARSWYQAVFESHWSRAGSILANGRKAAPELRPSRPMVSGRRHWPSFSPRSRKRREGTWWRTTASAGLGKMGRFRRVEDAEVWGHWCLSL
jgi:hypothetical protein